jgi:hypothetical protein
MGFRAYRWWQGFSAAVVVLMFGVLLGCQGMPAAQTASGVHCPVSQFFSTEVGL